MTNPDHNFTKGGKPWKPVFIHEIRYEVCTGCGFCVKVCPAGVFSQASARKPLILSPEDCIGCGVCQKSCKVGAVFCRPISAGSEYE